MDTLQCGFKPVVVEDAVTDRSKSAHKQALFDMQTKYADVVCSNDIFSKVHEL